MKEFFRSKKHFGKKSVILCSLLGSLVLGDEAKKAAETTEYTGKKPCVASPSWFKKVGGTRQTPPPNEGPTSPFANQDTVSNCDFHKWSWQKFLWLTNEVDGQPQFLNILKQVTSTGQFVDRKNGAIELVDTAQASNHSDILKTPGDPSTTVYYAIFMDESMYGTMVKYAPLDKADPDSVTEQTFPVGALEVKSSWIDASALADSSNFFVTKGTIGGKIVDVALLGMHVVGVVENHPEFVWATFEHEGLAPMYDWSKATPTTDAPITSDVAYPLFGLGATASVKNITSKNGIYTDVFSVYQYGTPVEKNAENKKVFMETSQPGLENFANISSINKSVKKQLDGVWNNYFYNGSIWINTEDAEGTKEQAQLLNSMDVSDASPGTLVRGSVAAYNITMETYVQVGFSSDGIHKTKVGDLVSCFLCHSTSAGGGHSPLHFSHVYNGYLGSLKGHSKQKVKQQHIDYVQSKLLKLKK